MILLTKELFITTIDSLQMQVSKDIAASNAINQVFDTDAVYDNSLLVKAIIKLLQLHFPKEENGFCEIEHYCFDMNFGKIQGEELITSEDLWDRLTEIKTKWHFLKEPGDKPVLFQNKEELDDAEYLHLENQSKTSVDTMDLLNDPDLLIRNEANVGGVLNPKSFKDTIGVYNSSIMESIDSFTDNLDKNGINPPKLRGILGMTSTHPLIDDDNPDPDGK